MIVHGCIEIHPKDCRGWIIVTGFRVLLISQHLFLKILLEAVLGVHAGSVKIKKYLHLDVVMMHLLHKGFMEITCVGMQTENYLFVMRAWQKGWLG